MLQEKKKWATELPDGSLKMTTSDCRDLHNITPLSHGDLVRRNPIIT